MYRFLAKPMTDNRAASDVLVKVFWACHLKMEKDILPPKDGAIVVIITESMGSYLYDLIVSTGGEEKVDEIVLAYRTELICKISDGEK